MMKWKQYTIIACLFIIGLVMNTNREVKAASWTDPATIYKVTDENREELYNTFLPGSDTETYNPNTRKFQAFGVVEKTENGRLYAAWQTGGTHEPSELNYVVVAVSDDNGKSWIDPFIIIDLPSTGPYKTIVPILWLDSEGRLWIFYDQRGTWAIIIDEPDAPLEEISWTRKGRMFNPMPKRPTLLNDGTWIIAVEPPSYVDINKNNTYVYASKDNGKSFRQVGFATSEVDLKKFHESQIVELSDNRLMMLSRVERSAGVGGIEVSYSSDKGTNWTMYEHSLPSPLRGPGSKFHIMKLLSGNLLLINHDTGLSRSKLAAYLSTDDGKTWPYKLMLETRGAGVEYPDAMQDKEGNIHVIYNYGRDTDLEIRMSIFTEADVKAGVFLSDNSQQRMIVSKLGSNCDIISTTTVYSRNVSVNYNTDFANVSKRLPTTINVTDDYANNYQLNGSWESDTYNPKKSGYYLVEFKSSDLPDDVYDNYGIMQVIVEVLEAPKGEKNSNLALYLGVGFGLLVVTASIYLVIKKRKGYRSET